MDGSALREGLVALLGERSSLRGVPFGEHAGGALDLAGRGLRDTTRIAASSPEMWRDICLWNRDNLVQLIEVYEQHLRQLKELIKSGDGPGLEKEMEAARTVREQLNGQPT